MSKQYKITAWFSIDSVISRARLAILLGDKVIKPIYIDWLGRAVIVMEECDITHLPKHQHRYSVAPHHHEKVI